MNRSSTAGTTRRAALAAVATGVLAGAALFTTGPAAAAPSSGSGLGSSSAPSDVTAAAGVAAAAKVSAAAAVLAATETGGSYLDGAGRPVVTVTSSAAAAKVAASGVVTRTVSRSTADLDRVVAALDGKARIAGTSWAVDPVTNQVLVTADSTVTGTALARVVAVVEASGGAARLERTGGTLRPTLSGGQAIYRGGGGRCSAGFNVQSSNGTKYFLTAGHCGSTNSTWFTNSAQTASAGTMVGSSFPGNDYALVRYAGGVSTPGNVFLYSGSSTQDITSAGTPTVGQTVRRSGSTTGVRSGQVQALNATVNYAEGSVTGLIRTSVCAEPGDSGGSLFSGTTAYGMTSGGSGNCSSGGTTYFQPVTEALGVYGVSVY